MRSIRFGGPSLCAVALFTACLSVLTLAPEFTVADEPLPTMPEGAGKADADAPTEFTATESGLKYRVLRKGSGEKPTGADTVEVNYHGWLDDGKVFDSSYKRGESISFPLNRVIELEIPSDLGYGPRGTPGGPIPPNARLHFLVELIEVK
jgi:FKBP-type peptidyl-prolyl cis-trans isomerase FkpA